MNESVKFQAIDINAGNQLINDRDPVIVDVRDVPAYQQSHIADATLINNANLHEFLQQTDRDRPLLVYCYHGHMSRNAAQYFAEAGFSEVYSLGGGFEAWRQEFPVTPGDAESLPEQATNPT